MKTTEDFLTEQGFNRYESRPENGFFNRKVLYQRRIENVAPVCQCNDKLHLNINLFEYEIHGNRHTSAEVDITGEMPDGEWAKLSIYSVKPAELPAKLANIEQRLIKAWEASCSLAPVESTREETGT